MKRAIPVIAACLGLIVPALAQNYPDQNPENYDHDHHFHYVGRIPAGTHIRIRTDEPIHVRGYADNRIYYGRVAEDVIGENGQVMIPRGARAELIVTNLGDHEKAVDLESISFDDHRYMVDATAYEHARHPGLGENQRTGEYVGGGALLGTIIGAIAGGGKGAAIGALAGGGAGAGTEVLTRGREVHIPAESVLTFRLEQPLDLGHGRWAHDEGENRDGHHYHDNYYGQYPQ